MATSLSEDSLDPTFTEEAVKYICSLITLDRSKTILRGLNKLEEMHRYQQTTYAGCFLRKQIPSKWNETLKCRTCKRRLTQFLSSFFTNQMKQYIKEDQRFIVAGAADNNSQEAVVITHTAPGPYVSTELTCNAEETDTRIWLHV